MLMCNLGSFFRYDFVLKFWRLEPGSRPTFASIVLNLNAFSKVSDDGNEEIRL